MKMIPYILFIISLPYWSCRFDYPELESENTHIEVAPVPALEIVWQIPLNSDTTIRHSITPEIFNHGILFSSEKVSSNEPVVLKLIDSNGTDLIWETGETFETNCLSLPFIQGSGSYIYDNYYVTTCSGEPRVVNVNSGSVLWHYSNFGTMGPQLTHFENLIFHVHNTGSNPYLSTSIVMADIYTGIWDTIFTLGQNDAYSVNFSPPSVSVQVNGDTILYFQNRQWKSAPYDGKIEFYCYNMTADSIVWMINDLDEHGNSAVYPPLLQENRIYFKGGYTVYCIDTETGEIIWEQGPGTLGGDLMYSNLLLEENILIVKTSGSGLLGLDPVSGDVLWSNFDAGSSPADLVYFEGIIYYGSKADGLMRAIHVISGDEIWRMDSPNDVTGPSKGASFSKTVAIDPVLRRLYSVDGYYLICFQLE